MIATGVIAWYACKQHGIQKHLIKLQHELNSTIQKDSEFKFITLITDIPEIQEGKTNQQNLRSKIVSLYSRLQLFGNRLPELYGFLLTLLDDYFNGRTEFKDDNQLVRKIRNGLKDGAKALIAEGNK